MSVSNEDLQYLLSLGLTEEEALAVLSAPPIDSQAIASSVSSGLEIQPQTPTIEQTISDQIVSTGNNVEAQEAQTRLDNYGNESSDASVLADSSPTPLTEEQSISITQDIIESHPDVAEYYGSNPNATLDSILPDVYVPPMSSIDVKAMPSADDIFGTDYGDGSTISTSPTSGGIGDFSDNVTTPIEEQYGEQVTFDTSGNIVTGPQSGTPGIPISSLPGVGGLENAQYSPRKKIGFRERTDIPPVGNDIGSPPQNNIPSPPPVGPDVSVPPPSTPPTQPNTVGSVNVNSGSYSGSYGSGYPASNGMGLQQTNEPQISFGNTQSTVTYRSSGGLILGDPMPGYKGRGK